MLDFQKCVRSSVYSRLDPSVAGRDDDLKAECDLGVGHSSTGEESCLVQMGSYCQIKPRWVSARLKARLVAKSYSQGV